MKTRILSVGHKVPGWIQVGFDEYAKRLPPAHRIELVEIPPVTRNKSISAAQAVSREAKAIRQARRPGSRLVVLDEAGRQYSTVQLAAVFDEWAMQGRDLDLVIGGADGVDPVLKHQADNLWSLSALTLPHPLVRVVVAEQLYRVWSIRHQHPYHRA